VGKKKGDFNSKGEKNPLREKKVIPLTKPSGGSGPELGGVTFSLEKKGFQQGKGNAPRDSPERFSEHHSQSLQVQITGPGIGPDKEKKIKPQGGGPGQKAFSGKKESVNIPEGGKSVPIREKAFLSERKLKLQETQRTPFPEAGKERRNPHPKDPLNHFCIARTSKS